jgi:hypothetical protein
MKKIQVRKFVIVLHVEINNTKPLAVYLSVY